MSDQKRLGEIFRNGILDENPTFRMVLGMCPTLAISTAVNQGIGMRNKTQSSRRPNWAFPSTERRFTAPTSRVRSAPR